MKRKSSELSCEEETWKPDFLSKKYSHERDPRLKFYEGPHLYEVDWNGDGKFSSQDIVSVTGFVHNYFPHFDPDAVIIKMKQSTNWPKSKYFGMSPEDIKAQWNKAGEDACRLGTIMHEEIECLYNGKEPENPTTEFKQFEVYYNKMKKKWLPFRTEWKLFSSSEYKLTGTIDMLYIHRDISERESISKDGTKTLHLRMSDWKRSKQIKRFSPFSCGLGICSELPDCNFFHYALQLNTYKYMLERWYKNIVVDGVVYDNIVIDQMYLVVMHPDTRKHYAELLLPNFQDLVGKMFDARKTLLESKKNEQNLI